MSLGVICNNSSLFFIYCAHFAQSYVEGGVEKSGFFVLITRLNIFINGEHLRQYE